LAHLLKQGLAGLKGKVLAPELNLGLAHLLKLGSTPLLQQGLEGLLGQGLAPLMKLGQYSAHLLRLGRVVHQEL
jgi:hypothetical protein